MSLTLVTLPELGLAETIALLNEGFSDYLVPIQFGTASLLHMLAMDGVDANNSQVVMRDGRPVGVALIARRGWNSRLAGMAIVPEARGQGVGTWLMAQLIEQAKSRGDRRLVLEVIERNEVAVRLYSACGFQTVRRLVSFSGKPMGGGMPAELEEIDLRDLALLVAQYGLPDLPWQISGESLALLGRPNRAYRLAKAYVAISSPDGSGFAIRALLVKPDARRQGQATRLLRALAASFPGKRWTVPALCPEEAAGPFDKIGLARGTIAQFQMELLW